MKINLTDKELLLINIMCGTCKKELRGSKLYGLEAKITMLQHKIQKALEKGTTHGTANTNRKDSTETQG